MRNSRTSPTARSLVAGASLSLALSGVLTLGIAGCGQQPTEEKVEEKTEQVEQVGATINWIDVADAEAAAKGAGIEQFDVPESITIGNITFTNPKFSYAGGVAQALYESGAAGLFVRKGEGAYTAPLTDRDKSEFTSEWTESYDGLDVTLYGATQAEATVMTWADGTANYGVTYQGLGGEELSMNDSESAAVVKAVREANAPKQAE